MAKATVCKTVIPVSNPGAASIFLQGTSWFGFLDRVSDVRIVSGHRVGNSTYAVSAPTKVRAISSLVHHTTPVTANRLWCPLRLTPSVPRHFDAAPRTWSGRF